MTSLVEGKSSQRKKGSLGRQFAMTSFLRYPLCVLVGVVWVVGLLVWVPPVRANQAPQWTVTAVSGPTNFAPSDETGNDVYDITVMNTGGASSDGSPITIADTLPEGLVLDRKGITAFDRTVGQRNGIGAPLDCEGTTCTYSNVVEPEEALVVKIPVDVELGKETSVTNLVTVSGGGATGAFMRTPTRISSQPASFNIAPGSVNTALSTTQAGAHADLTTTIGFNTVDAKGTLAGAPKETVDELPPGFAGDLVDTPSCSVALFSVGQCPIDTQIGITTLTLNGGVDEPVTEPVYNLAPSPGFAAKLGFLAVVFNIQGDVIVRPGDYGLRTTFHNIDESPAELDSASLTIWGVPASPIHNVWRWNPSGGSVGSYGATSDSAIVPFLSNPTSCSGEALSTVLSSRSWEEPGLGVQVTSSFGPLGACDRLSLPSTFGLQPTTTSADAPTGLNVELGVQQSYNNPNGLAASNLKRAVVTLPEGMTVNPSSGAGLGACTLAEYAEEAAETAPGAGCPNDAKLGSVKIQSPSLKEEAIGSVYIAQPYSNPFGSLLALYVIARIPDRGVLVKAAGEVMADPLTGRLTTTFDDLPPLPFSLLTFSFRQGETSPLVSPPSCGSYAGQIQLNPWANPAEALIDVAAPFGITSSFDGGACLAGSAPPFAPQVSAGTLNNNAGTYTDLDIRITRNDGEQEITGFSSQLPAGLTAKLTGVPYCPDVDIALAKSKTGAQEEAEPSCPASSLIGHTLVGAGVGSVLAWTSGKVYMAGPYNGAPFSIVAITSAKVGPFDLGTVVVREALEINPETADVTVDASASDKIPHIIDGIVIHVRDIRVYIDRGEFTLNPTSCEPMIFAVTVAGSGEGLTNTVDDPLVTVNNRFQAADCQNLEFRPKFKVATVGKASRQGGIGLAVKLTYPDAAQGTQANIKSVKVELPKRLPSRLSTLQKACVYATFNADPAMCPVASVVGTAVAITPILPVPLRGPAYFVSRGSAKFPELIIVLKGDGVTLDLHGETAISKRGITTSTFRTVPDDPIGSFELRLPEGRYSALAANGDLCKGKLVVPTTFTAQNGVVIHQSNRVTVAGCRLHKSHKRKKKAAGR